MLQNAPPFHVSLARTTADLNAAQRLRYDVFVAELGGAGEGVDHAARRETDAFDAFADHLLLRDTRRLDSDTDGVVGVYRLMTEAHAATAGRFYSESEFDLSPLKDSGRKLLELGRSCLHPDQRGGAGLMALWQGLADYAVRNRIEVLFGTASFHGTDPDRLLHPISHLHATYLAPAPLRVTSHMAQPVELLPPDKIDRKAAMRDTPALIKSYLKLGGTIGQGVYVDHAFNTTDVCLILEVDRLDPGALHRPARRPT
jgi:putative hemolysin